MSMRRSHATLNYVVSRSPRNKSKTTECTLIAGTRATRNTQHRRNDCEAQDFININLLIPLKTTRRHQKTSTQVTARQYIVSAATGTTCILPSPSIILDGTSLALQEVRTPQASFFCIYGNPNREIHNLLPCIGSYIKIT